ncbi:MAG: hypothetical protein A2147_06465 [Chloroflexi bacterium RBG_16_57_8]|nr:MAG: hypothetical protein A2147_06465 [Chloroflexi bacterium RBG_16_57_8]
MRDEDYEQEVFFGRTNNVHPGGAPPPKPGARYVARGLILGVIAGGALGTVVGILWPSLSFFVTAIAGTFCGAIVGTVVGDRFRRWKRKKTGVV